MSHYQSAREKRQSAPSPLGENVLEGLHGAGSVGNGVVEDDEGSGGDFLLRGEPMLRESYMCGAFRWVSSV